MRNAEKISTKGKELFSGVGTKGHRQNVKGQAKRNVQFGNKFRQNQNQSSELKVSEYMMSLPELVQRLSACVQNFVGGRLRPFFFFFFF